MLFRSFKISPLPNSDGKWIVKWPGLTAIETIEMKWKLLSLLFDTLKLYEVGLGYNLPYYGQKNEEWAVQWISCEAWHGVAAQADWHEVNSNNRKMFIMNLLFTNQQRYSGNTVNGVVVHTLDSAEQLVHEFEKLITLHLLKEEYATR